MRKLVLLLAFASLLGGCTLLVDDKVGGITVNAVPDMTLHLVGMDPHVGQLTEIFLVNDQDPGLVQAVAIYDPLPSVDVDVELANVVAPDVRRVDFYADLSRNGQLDAPMPDPDDSSRLLFPDHMWRLTLDQNGEATFMHNTNFTDIVGDDPASFVGTGPLSLTITGVGAFADQPATVVAWGPGEREVGFYFLQTIGGDTLSIDFEGRQFVDDGTEYIVEITLGDDPHAQPVCITGTATDRGLTIEAPLAALEHCPTQ
jgi:hypothetical protein